MAEVYDGKTATIYFDGAEVGTSAGTGEMRENENAQWWIGSMYAIDRWFDGLIDEVRIWKRALTVEEIQKAVDGTLVSLAVSRQDKLATLWGSLKSTR